MYPVLLSIAAVVLYFLSQPNEIFLYGQPIAGLVCFIPLFLALRRTKSFWASYGIGVLFLSGSNLIITYWLANFGDFALWTVLGVSIGYAWFYASTVIPILWFFYRRGSVIETSWLIRFRPLLVAAVWAGYEFLKSNGFLAFPWALAAYPVNNIPAAIQTADLGGVYLVSFLMILLQTAAAEWFFRGDRPRLGLGKIAVPVSANLLAAGVLAILALGYGFIKLIPTAKANQTTLTTVLVQQNLDSWKNDGPDTVFRLAQGLSRAPIAGRALPDLTVWSETSIRLPVAEYQSYYRKHPIDETFFEFLSKGGAPLLSGSPKDLGHGEYANAVILFNGEGRELDWYAKQQLIPFAEYVPGWNIPFLRDFVENVIGLPSGGWKPGPGVRNMAIPLRAGGSVLAGTPICFEDALATVPADMARQGAQVLINLTNNAWSKTLSAQTQHFAAARFRAVETRLPLLRSTNGGLTCVVRPDGSIQDLLPMFAAASLYSQVSVPQKPELTPYVWSRDLFAIVCIVVGLGAVVWLGLVRPRLPTRRAH